MNSRHLTTFATNLALLVLGVAPVYLVTCWFWLNRHDDLARLLPKLPIALAYNLIIFAIPLGLYCLLHYILMLGAQRLGGLAGRRLRTASVTATLFLALAAITAIGWRNLHSAVTSVLLIGAAVAFGMLAHVPSSTESLSSVSD